MRTLAQRGMPVAGSIQDRVACEMVTRERHRSITEHSYLGRILASSLNLPEKLFSLWTHMLSLEVSQQNYAPATFEDKRQALQRIDDARTEQKDGRVKMFKKLQKMTVPDADLQPVSAEEVEAARRRIRAWRLRNAMRGNA